MNVVTLKSGFTRILNIGRYCLFVKLGDGGSYHDVPTVFEKAQHYPHIVVYGEDVLEDKKEVAELFTKLVKHNNNIRLELHVRGHVKPVASTKYNDNIKYVVMPRVKGDPKYKYNQKAAEWFNQVGADFLFLINNKEDIDVVNFWVNSVGINKSKVFLTTHNNIELIIKYAKLYNYNVAPEVDWNE